MLDLLYEALASPYGIVVESTDPLLLRTKLYSERRKDPSFNRLSFVLSPTNPTSELWILITKEPAK